MRKEELIETLQKIEGNPEIDIVVDITFDTCDVYSVGSVVYNEDENVIDINTVIN